MVPASELLDLGIGLMDTCERSQNETYKATRYRDGLPHRAAHLLPNAAQEPDGLGHRPAPGGRRPRLPGELDGGRDQVRQTLRRGRPARADPLHRPLAAGLPACAINGSRQGEDRRYEQPPLGHPVGRADESNAIRSQIESHTRQAFAKAIWPHLFRDCAVTELVDCAPEEIRIAPDLLGHADLGTTRRYYIQAQGMTAHRRIQELIAARRRAAAQG